MQTIAFTGHRSLPKEATFQGFCATLDAQIGDPFQNTNPKDTEFVTGGALGVDTWAAEYAISRGIPFTLILPFPIHIMGSYWTPIQRMVLAAHARRAKQVIILSQTYDIRMYQERNVAMIDRADVVFAVWDGRPTGGTANAVRYAQRCQKPMFNLLRPGGRFDGKVASI